MRAAAILGLGCSRKELKPFQSEKSVEWMMGVPSSRDVADVVLVFGGDGTVHRHLGSLVRLGLPVLVVPAGSGNDFARALGLRRVRDSLEAWRKYYGGGVCAENVRAIDLGVIAPLESTGGDPFDKLRAGSSTTVQGTSAPDTARYFCCVAGVGFDGEVAQRANRLPRWLRGHGGYLLSVPQTILTFAPLRMKVFTAEEDEAGWTTRSDQPTILAAFANTPVYGGGMKVAPSAKTDDGLLDVCIVGAVDRFRLLRLFPTVYQGNHLKIPEVSYFQTSRARVEVEHPLDVYADGEYVCRTPVEVGVHRGALRVVVP